MSIKEIKAWGVDGRIYTDYEEAVRAEKTLDLMGVFDYLPRLDEEDKKVVVERIIKERNLLLKVLQDL